VALTYFEFGTLAAWEVFAAADVEAVILEVGLGGRLDAVNAYEPDISIVTTVLPLITPTGWGRIGKASVSKRLESIVPASLPFVRIPIRRKPA
jgi:hypothetical protein